MNGYNLKLLKDLKLGDDLKVSGIGIVQQKLVISFSTKLGIVGIGIDLENDDKLSVNTDNA